MMLCVLGGTFENKDKAMVSFLNESTMLCSGMFLRVDVLSFEKKTTLFLLAWKKANFVPSISQYT